MKVYEAQNFFPRKKCSAGIAEEVIMCCSSSVSCFIEKSSCATIALSWEECKTIPQKAGYCISFALRKSAEWTGQGIKKAVDLTKRASNTGPAQAFRKQFDNVMQKTCAVIKRLMEAVARCWEAFVNNPVVVKSCEMSAKARVWVSEKIVSPLANLFKKCMKALHAKVLKPLLDKVKFRLSQKKVEKAEPKKDLFAPIMKAFCEVGVKFIQVWGSKPVKKIRSCTSFVFEHTLKPVFKAIGQFFQGINGGLCHTEPKKTNEEQVVICLDDKKYEQFLIAAKKANITELEEGCSEGLGIHSIFITPKDLELIKKHLDKGFFEETPGK